MITVTDILDAIDAAIGDTAVSAAAMRCNPDAESPEPEMWSWVSCAYADVPGIVVMDAYAVGATATMRVRFGNGWHASGAPNSSAVIHGRYQLALIARDGNLIDADGFDDVLCGLDDGAVVETLREIAALPAPIGA